MQDTGDYVARVVSNAKGIGEGIAALAAYGRCLLPDDPVWDQLAGIDFVADARSVAAGLTASLRRAAVPDECDAWYCGLDESAKIELAATDDFDGDAPSECGWDVRLNGLRSKALGELHRRVEGGSLAEYVFGLGYPGLALRFAFAGALPALTLGAARRRAVCWGWHDGDLFTLGVLDRHGFTPTRRGAPRLPSAARVKRTLAPAQQARPEPAPRGALKLPARTGAGAEGWFAFAEALCAQAPPAKRAELVGEVSRARERGQREGTRAEALVASSELWSRVAVLHRAGKRAAWRARLNDVLPADDPGISPERAASWAEVRHDAVSVFLHLGDHAAAAESVRATERLLARAQRAKVPAAIIASVQCELAQMEHAMGNGAASRRYLAAAIAGAKRITRPSARMGVETLIELLVTLGLDAEAEAWVRKQSSPAARVEAALRAARTARRMVIR